MTEKVEIMEMLPFFAAIIKVRTNPETIGDDHKRSLPQVMAYLQKNKVQPIGPPLKFYFQTNSDTVWEIGAGFPVAIKMEGDDTVDVIEVPAGTVATLLHVGPYDGLGASWNAFGIWHKEQGYELDMEAVWCWESFLTFGDNSLDESQHKVKLHWML